MDKNKSLKKVKKDGILSRMISIFNKLLGKRLNKSNEDNNYPIKNLIDEANFEEDIDMKDLLKIQNEIEIKGINKKNIYELTKELNETQRNKLINLYNEQIKNYENITDDCKNRILKLRKKD